MDLRQVRHFVTLADAHSFTLAAAELRMSQPALSQSIARLERELGCRLVERNKQNPGVGLTLTRAGESLYADGQSLLAAARRTEERVRRAGRSATRTSVAIGFASSTPRALVAAALAIPDSLPEIDVVPVQLDWGREHLAVESGLVDLAYLQHPVGMTFPGHEVRGIVRVARGALFAAAHPLAAGASVTLAQLAAEPILDPGFDPGPAGMRDFWLGLPRPTSAPLGPVVAPPAHTVEEMNNFVAAGRGMAITSRVVAEQNARSDVVFREIVDLQPVEVGIARLADDDRPRVLAVYATLEALSML
jgi:DNA-binding transcriptional LysR family regulator